MLPGNSRNEDNPRKSDIDQAWWPIRDDLAKGNARAVADALANFRETDKGLWNALYWRTNAWLCGRAAIYPQSRSEQEIYGDDKIEMGRDRLSAAVIYLYPDRRQLGQWWGEDLPRILQNLERAVMAARLATA